MDPRLRDLITLHIQDVEYTVKTSTVTPQTSLNDYLRKNLHLTGTKSMCYEGGCGACIVAVRNKDPTSGNYRVHAVNSCLVSILSCHEWKIYTIEGIGNSKIGYHPVQKALASFNGTQCGFCSPGMVMNMFALSRDRKVTMKEVENSFAGNICRCTGYRPILTAFKSLCVDADEKLLGELPDLEDINCIPCRGVNCGTICRKTQPFLCRVGKSTWIKLYTLKDLQRMLNQFINSHYMLVAGNTAKGVYNAIATGVEVFIDVADVKDLTSYNLENGTLTLGANMTLTNTMNLFNELSNQVQFSYLKKMADHIDLIANVPVRNIGTLGGNLMIKHEFKEFPSDIFLIFETVGAIITIVDTDDNKSSMSLTSFLNYNMKGKILTSIAVHALDASYKYESYKIMPRAQNAHALVNAGFLFHLSDASEVLHSTIVYGSINPSFIHAQDTEQYLIGKKLFNDATLQEAFKKLDQEIKPDFFLPDPPPEFRRKLAVALFYKYVLSIAPDDVISARNKSGGAKFDRPVSNGVQDFGTNKSLYPLTQPVTKIEALAQTSGEAQYLYDMPDLPNQLYAAFVLAKTKPRSVIEKIDPSKALKVEGVVAFFDKDDIPGRNTFTPKEVYMPLDEELFCSGIVLYNSQPVGVIVAKSQETAELAAEMVEITYKKSQETPLYTVRDILRANAKNKIIKETSTTPKRKGNDVKHVVKGSFDIGWQYHFNMETQYCGAVPTEDGLDMYAATQWMDLTQASASVVLNIPAHKINVVVRRLGGAYGSKISRNAMTSSAVALAAYKLKQPVKMWMPLKTNMMVVGKRYPCSCDYEVGVNSEGVIQYLDATFYSDFGSNGGSENTVGETMSLLLGKYNTDTWKVSANSTRSDCHAGTWCRAPGTTEGLAMIESIMDHIAYMVDIDPLEVRISNFDDSKRDKLVFFINEMKTWAEIDKRKMAIGEFNTKNRWRKRGMSVVPMAYRFGLFGSWTVIVSIYQIDGTVAVAHGGIEMGQGINTKVAQVCAYALGIPLDFVSVKPSNNLVSPNTMYTGGSITSEAVCYGVLQACQVLVDRIKPIREQIKDATWPQLIKKCYEQYIDLTATYMYSPKAPNLASYTIFGVCATEVEIDILTGLHQVLRVDILEDTGNSMSPNIDIGQVEGAFVMGMGYWTTEEIIMNDDGEILTNRTWNYKPPGAKDIPINFRVKFPKNNPNEVGVLKSKATAEPPLTMTVSVPLAIRNAVAGARVEADRSQPLWYPFDGPSSVQNTFMNSLHDYKQYML